MEIRNAKCSSSKHADVNAVSFCPDCGGYWCDGFQNCRTEMFKTIKHLT